MTTIRDRRGRPRPLNLAPIFAELQRRGLTVCPSVVTLDRGVIAMLANTNHDAAQGYQLGADTAAEESRMLGEGCPNDAEATPPAASSVVSHQRYEDRSDWPTFFQAPPVRYAVSVTFNEPGHEHKFTAQLHDTDGCPLLLLCSADTPGEAVAGLFEEMRLIASEPTGKYYHRFFE